ncbi:MAG: HAMP domain-containing histidine kinase [Lachnospiraceae bacterium]|nr:HAMP domain-containing histidine kinase [Lachnospiraceae bacterium]
MPDTICQDSSSSARTSDTELFYRHYISSLSHELRNTFTLIYSSLQIIEKSCPCVSDLPLWPQTLDDIRYTIRLLKDTSAMTRDYPLKLTAFSAHDFLEELSVSARPFLEEHHIQLHTNVNCAAGTQIHIHADRSRLKEALTNLLINAADALSAAPFSHDRHIYLTVEYQPDMLRQSAAGICFSVKDNGPGIPETYLQTLFDPFVTHKPGGTGLGLSIVRDIAVRHGGTVSVETNALGTETYTDFHLFLPGGRIDS